MSSSLGRELLSTPLPEIVERLGCAIANAQHALDRTALSIAAMMSDREEHGVPFGPDGEKRSLLELGFTPTFYQITEATVEAKVAFSMSSSQETSLSVGVTVGVVAPFVMVAASVNASYTNKYSFEASGSSSITARFTAIPPPSILTTLLAQRAAAPAPDAPSK